MSLYIDRTGWVMSEHGVEDSRLTVLGPGTDYVDPHGNIRKRWRVICNCGKSEEFLLTTTRLKTTKSCGCLRSEVTKQRVNKTLFYEINEEFNYAIVYTSKNEPFWVDLDDLDRVLQYCWSYNSHGYIQANSKDPQNCSPILLHRFIMNMEKGDKRNVDHKVHAKNGEKQIDHRKSNLRIVSPSANSMNTTIRANNTSGHSGVYYNKLQDTWTAEIRENGNYHFLGNYKVLEDAIAARIEGEKKYHREYSFFANNEKYV